jgi:hypothetical protein
MAVYVDYARNKLGRLLCSHMIADSLAELHAMARAIGMKRKWFQGEASFPHYDVSQTRRREAVRLGAVEVGRRELVHVMRRYRQGDEWKQYLSSGAATPTCLTSGGTLSATQEEPTPLPSTLFRRLRPCSQRSTTG